MKTFISLLLMFTSPVFADHRVGNGGDAVVCRDPQGKIIKVELLDYYEAEHFYHIDLDVGDESLSPLQIVEFVLDRFKATDAAKAEKYKRRAAQFLGLVDWHDGYLVDVPDELGIGYEHGCKPEQLVTRNSRADTNRDLKPFVIRTDLYEVLDNKNKAGTILHEIIYEDFVKTLDETHSINARNFHIYMASHRFDAMTLLDYLDFVNGDLGIANFEFTINGNCVTGNPGTAWRANRLAQVSSCSFAPFKVGALQFPDAVMNMASDGSIRGLSFTNTLVVEQFGASTTLKIQPYTNPDVIHNLAGRVESFYDAGAVRNVSFSFTGCLDAGRLGFAQGQMSYNANCTPFTSDQRITLNENGTIQSWEGMALKYKLNAACDATGVPKFDGNGVLVGYKFLECNGKRSESWTEVSFWPGTVVMESAHPGKELTFSLAAGSFTIDVVHHSFPQFIGWAKFSAQGKLKEVTGYFSTGTQLRDRSGRDTLVNSDEFFTAKFDDDGYYVH